MSYFFIMPKKEFYNLREGDCFEEMGREWVIGNG